MVALLQDDYWLAIDSCHASGSIVLMQGDAVLEYWEDTEAGTQVERMVPALHALLEDAKLEWRSLKAVAVTIGPGSFTGVRIGLTIAKGLNIAHGLLIIPVGCLEVVIDQAKGRYVLAIINARRSQLYVQASNDVPELSNPMLIEERALSDLLQALPDGTELLAFGDMPQGITASVAGINARYVVQFVWKQREALEGLSHDRVEPLYIRPPDAKKSVPFLEKIRSGA